MIEFKCTGYTNKTKDSIERIMLDFATKLLWVYKFNKHLLFDGIHSVIYEYIYALFPQVSVIDWVSKESKEFAYYGSKETEPYVKKIFEENGEVYDYKLLGGGEFPLIKIWETDIAYYYDIIR
jgi:hypothetical protein